MTPRGGEHPEREQHRWRDAAIEAELNSGRKEETRERARSHVAVRIARMTAGTLLVVLGLAAIPLPGPGWLIVTAGLALLARDVAWADRVLRYVRRKVPGIPEEGRIPRSTIVTVIFVTLAFVGVSTWWTVFR